MSERIIDLKDLEKGMKDTIYYSPKWDQILIAMFDVGKTARLYGKNLKLCDYYFIGHL